MATLTVSLPDPMNDWIDEQIEAGNYASSSEYLLDLIERDQENGRQIVLLRRAIEDAEASGVSSRSFDETLTEARLQARRRGLLK